MRGIFAPDPSAPEMPNSLAMRVLGLFIVLFTIIEFGVGSAVFNFLTNVSFGAWWIGLFTWPTAVLALSSKNRQVVTLGCVVSIIAVIVALVGASVDGAANTVFSGLQGCINTQTGDYSGSNDGRYNTMWCAGYFGSGVDVTGWQCACADTQYCYHYNLVQGNDCGGIITTYTSNLGASTAFGSILCILTFAYSLFTCLVVCTSGPTSAPAYTYNPAGPAAASVPVKVVYAQDDFEVRPL